jgi:YegS/Rv2252/BmrU family lipid kinase
LQVQLVVNPISGSGRGGRQLEELVGRLGQGGHHVDVYTTQSAEDGRQFAAGLDHHTDAVVAVGGDGTVSDIVSGLIDHPLPVALLPVGTENLLARELGYRPDVDLVLDALLGGREVCMDVGVVNGQRFLIVTGIGFDADVVRRLHSQRQGHITHLSYFWPLWETFWKYRFPPVRVTVEGKPLHDGPGLVFVGNMNRYALGLRILQDADWTDGKLDVCIFPCSGQGELLWHSFMTAVQYHVHLPEVVYAQGREVLVESPQPVCMEIDGDPAGELPARYSVLPGAARFLLPAPAKGTT